MAIPLFVEGAAVPKPKQLPADLVDLVYQNGVAVRHDPDFKRDVEHVIGLMRGVLDVGRRARDELDDVDFLTEARRSLPQAADNVRAGIVDSLAIAGFTFIGNDTFECANDDEGVKRFTVPVYRCDPFADAIALDTGARAIDTEFVLLPPPDYGDTKPEWTGGRFLIARTCVSQRVYDALGGKHDPYNWSAPSRPADQVSWNQAQAWMNAGDLLSARVRFPWKAEWEFAARAGTRTALCFGGELTERTRDLVNFGDGRLTYGRPTVDVGSLPGNAFGLHEIHGNVWEWCEDFEWRINRDDEDWLIECDNAEEGALSQPVRWVRARWARGGDSDSPPVAVDCESFCIWPPDEHAGFRPARSVD